MRKRIIELVCETETSLEQASKAQPLVETHGNIVAELIAIGFSPGVVLEAASAATGIRQAPMKWLRNPKLSGNLDPVLCRQIQAAPIAVDGGWLCIGYADPEMAVQGADLGFPPHQPYLAAPIDLQLALSLVEATGSATRPTNGGAPEMSRTSQPSNPPDFDDVTAPVQTLDDVTAPVDVPAPAEVRRPMSSAAPTKRAGAAVIPGTTVPQMPGVQARASTAPGPRPAAPPVVPVAPPRERTASALVAPTSAGQRAQIEDVTGDVAFGIGTARAADASASAPRPAPKLERREARSEASFASTMPPARSDEIPRHETSGWKDDVKDDVPQRREIAAPKSEPTPHDRGDRAGRVEVSQPKPKPPRRSGLVIEKASEINLPEPERVPLPPTVSEKRASASSSSSSSSSSSPSSSSSSSAYEPLDPAVEAPTKTKARAKNAKAGPAGMKKPAAEPEALAAAASAVAALAGDGPAPGTAAVAIELDGTPPSRRAAQLHIGVAISLVLVAIAIAVVIRPFEEPPPRPLTPEELIVVRQTALVAKARAEKDDARALALVAETIALDPTTVDARDATVERVRRSLAQGRIDEAKADVAVLQSRADAAAIDAFLSESVTKIEQLAGSKSGANDGSGVSPEPAGHPGDRTFQ